jgi:tRNA threonylcarbamoyladenosine biosynthesis protein TsaB
VRLLALDTATEACSVAVLTDAGCFGVSREVGRGHAEEILGMVDGTLAQGRLTLGMLDAIVASIGPGSFTGVRISVSVAQGLAFGAGIPVVAVTTLEALALQALTLSTGAGSTGGSGDVLACLDARMGEVYWGCFSTDESLGLVARSVPAVGPAASVALPFADCVAIGRGLAAYPVLQSLPGVRVLPGALAALPDARDMVRLGAIRFAAGAGMDPADLAPLYLRDKVALTQAERAAAQRVG